VAAASRIRKPVIAGNWKMYKTQQEARDFFAAFKPLVPAATHCEIVVAPPFTAIAASIEATKGSAIGIAGQNVYWGNEGAFTGEVSPRMLVEAGCRAVIIAHSERRQFFGETDESANRKVKAALAVGLTPILCVGEMLADREAGNTQKVLERQFRGSLAALTPVELAVASFTVEYAASLRILYGGSVKPENIKGLMAQAEIDGALVGGASLDAAQFAAIVNY
jgi:triosephosphate isomerase